MCAVHLCKILELFLSRYTTSTMTPEETERTLRKYLFPFVAEKLQNLSNEPGSTVSDSVDGSWASKKISTRISSNKHTTCRQFEAMYVCVRVCACTCVIIRWPRDRRLLWLHAAGDNYRSWFFENCSRETAESALLLGKQFGNVLIRESVTFKSTGSYVISMRREVSG